MIAEILTIGYEVVSGSILNTNTQYLSTRLIELGIEPLYHSSVDDNWDRLSDVFRIALKRADIIITTGGLGPTQDDLTKDVIANVLNLPMERDIQMELYIRSMFQKMNRPMTDNNLKQAEKPVGSMFIENNNGTAPGIFIKNANKRIILLPGPPRELIPMFEKFVADEVKDSLIILKRSINTIGIGESTLETELMNLNLYNNGIDIATYAKEGEIEIKIVGKGSNKFELEEKINNISNIISKNFSEFIYGYDNIPIEELVVNALKEKKLKIALCESCTGGLITGKLTRVPGASEVLDRGLVTYSNEAKIDELNVNPDTIKEFGAVSENTAYEMAKGLLEKTKADIVLSITGIAGPSGGSLEKPVGLVYMCIMTNSNYKIIKNIFSGNRNTIQNRSVIRALYEILNYTRHFQ